jgi:hypothetical protein
MQQDVLEWWCGQPQKRAQGALTTGTYFYVIKLSDGGEYSKFLTISR